MSDIIVYSILGFLAIVSVVVFICAMCALISDESKKADYED
jgi:hypothetical protein